MIGENKPTVKATNLDELEAGLRLEDPARHPLLVEITAIWMAHRTECKRSAFGVSLDQQVDGYSRDRLTWSFFSVGTRVNPKSRRYTALSDSAANRQQTLRLTLYK